MTDYTNLIDATDKAVVEINKPGSSQARQGHASVRAIAIRGYVRRRACGRYYHVAAICLVSLFPGKAGCVPSGGLGLAVLAEPLLDDAGARMGAGFIVGLIVFAAATTAWRTLLGRDRTKADVRIESDFITRTELDTRLVGLASEIERKFERALHEEFRLLNGERSRSIGNLHEKIETTADGLRSELNEVRAMIVEMPGRVVGMMRGRRKDEV